MIYLDTSVALAYLLTEDRRPSVSLWEEQLISSRLLEYEIWVRIHAYGLTASHSEAVAALLQRVALVEMVPAVLARALKPLSRAGADARCSPLGVGGVRSGAGGGGGDRQL